MVEGWFVGGGFWKEMGWSGDIWYIYKGGNICQERKLREGGKVGDD